MLNLTATQKDEQNKTCNFYDSIHILIDFRSFTCRIKQQPVKAKIINWLQLKNERNNYRSFTNIMLIKKISTAKTSSSKMGLSTILQNQVS